MYGLDFPGSVFLTIGDADTLWHPQFSVPKSLHLQRRELSYLPSAGRVPFVLLRLSCPSSTIFYLQHWILFHVIRTETCRTLLCRVHRYLLKSAIIVCLMGHTAVQTSATSVAQGFLAAEATLFHVLMPIETSRRQLVQRLSDEILHVRSRLDDPPDARGTDQNGRVTFLPKLFGTDAVQSPRVRVLWIRRCGQGLRFRFPWFWCSCVRSRMLRQPRDGWGRVVVPPTL